MILTLDIGTTYFKAALFGRDGRMRGLHRNAPMIEHPRPGEWELEADCFRAAIRAAIAELGAEDPDVLDGVEAITFATQTNSFLLLDADDQPLTPIILWPDDRAAGLADEVRRLSETPGFRATTGVPELTTQFMAAKLLWLRHERPDLWSRVSRLCLLSDYLTLWLTGRHVTEAGAAGLTGAVDIHGLRWWPEACDRLRLPGSWLPAVVRAGTDLGPVRTGVAAELGLPRGCRFVVGCLDQYAGAIGAGNTDPGGVSETTGTVLATVRCADGLAVDAAPDIFQGPAFDAGMYYQMVFGSTSANLLEWYRGRLPDQPGFDVLDRMAAGVPPGADGVRLRLPVDPGNPANSFVGMGEHRTTGHAARAIMETVALALADQVDRLCGTRRPPEIRSCGGAARSDVWLQIKADVVNTSFAATVCPEPTSLGAAMLAARALGWADLSELSRTWAQTRAPHRPDSRVHATYGILFRRA